MNNYVLSCCSTSDLSLDEYKNLDIEHIAFHYFMNDVEHIDDNFTSITSDAFYNAMSNNVKTRTSQVNVEEFTVYFEKFLKENKDIIHVTLSSGISGVINSATAAAALLREKYPSRKIIIVDSLCGSGGYALLMYKLSELRKNGHTIDELNDYAINNRLRIIHLLFPTDLRYFFSGGRVKKALGFISNIIHFCPIIEANKEGKMVLKKKSIGKKHALSDLYDLFKETVDNGVNYNDLLIIAHAHMKEEAEELKVKILSEFINLKDKIKIMEIGTTMGSHCGPGTMMLNYFGKLRK